MKYLFTLILVLTSFTSFCQTYNLTSSTSTYENFSDGTSVSTADEIELPFNFEIEKSYDVIYLNSGGISGSDAIISDFMFDLNVNYDRNSRIQYKVEGENGSRILKIQFEGIKFYEDTTELDSMEGQIWLYEGGLKLELRFGAIELKNKNSYGYNYVRDEYYSGLLCGLTTSEDNYMLKGSPSSPQIQTLLDFTSLNGHPNSGQVYTFTKSGQSVDDVLLNSIKIYPVPCTDAVNIYRIDATIDLEVAIYSLSGKLLIGDLKLVPGQKNLDIDITAISSGVYLVKLTSDKNTLYQRILIE